MPTGGNTFSDKQANVAIRDITQALDRCADQVQEKIQSFAKSTAQVWEDPNAVKFMKEVRTSYEKAIEEMSDNNKKFAKAMRGVVQMYNKIAGGGSLDITTPKTITKTIDVTAVKDKFDDGYVGTTMKSAEQMIKYMDDAEADIKKLGDQLKAQVNAANPFTNASVKTAVGRCANKVSEILAKHAKEVRNASDEYINEVARTYMKASEDAASELGAMADSAN